MQRNGFLMLSAGVLAIQAMLVGGCSMGTQRQAERAGQIDDRSARTASGRIDADTTTADTNSLTDPSWRGD